MDRFLLTLAGLPMAVEAEDSGLRSFCASYLRESGTPEFAVSLSDGDIAAFREEHPELSLHDAALLCLHRAIAERLPAFDRMLVHGAAIRYAGQGYLFLAPSGTGKSTHIRLWRECFGSAVGIVNGDKPMLDLSDVPTVYGTPWAGKEGWQSNTSAPLRAVCLLRRGTEDTITRIAPAESFEAVLAQLYRPGDGGAWLKTLVLADRLFARVPLYLLSCTPTERAARLAFAALTTAEERQP